MAGDWIQMRHDLAEDPAVIGIAERTGLEEDAVIGKLHRIWSWVDRQTMNGNAAGVTLAWLDRFVKRDGFAAAMIAVGWLEELCVAGMPGMRIPKFDRYISESAKTRALTARRARKCRNGKRNGKTVTRSVTKRAPKEEKRRVSPNGDITPTPFPPALAGEEFATAWEDWLRHREEIGHALKETGRKNALKKLADMGGPRAVAAIRHSIANGWQGLFEPKEDSYRGRTLFPPAENPARPRDAEPGPDRYPPGCSPADQRAAAANAAEGNGEEHA